MAERGKAQGWRIIRRQADRLTQQALRLFIRPARGAPEQPARPHQKAPVVHVLWRVEIHVAQHLALIVEGLLFKDRRDAHGCCVLQSQNVIRR